jgi:hypothetical protein
VNGRDFGEQVRQIQTASSGLYSRQNGKLLQLTGIRTGHQPAFDGAVGAILTAVQP